MATLRITLLNQNRKVNGLIPIYFALSHKKQTRFINTGYVVEDFQFENGLVVCRNDSSMINKRLKYMLSQYQEALENIDDISAYSCSQLKDIIINKPSNTRKVPLLSEYMNERIKKFYSEKRNNYADMNKFSLNLFIKSEGEITLKSISIETITHFEKYLEKKEYSNATKQIVLSHIKATINEAINDGHVSYQVHPFSKTSMPKSEDRELDISIADFQKIKNATFTEKGSNSAAKISL